MSRPRARQAASPNAEEFPCPPPLCERLGVGRGLLARASPIRSTDQGPGIGRGMLARASPITHTDQVPGIGPGVRALIDTTRPIRVAKARAIRALLPISSDDDDSGIEDDDVAFHQEDDHNNGVDNSSQ
jgi:hypothetical protein